MATPYDPGTPAVNPPNPRKARPPARERKPKRPVVLTPGITLESIVMALDGGWLPPDGTGEFTPKVLGVLMGKDADTVRSYVKDYSVPVRQLGDEILIAPEAIRAACPLEVWSGRKARPK